MLPEILKIILCDYQFNLVLKNNHCTNRNKNNKKNPIFFTLNNFIEDERILTPLLCSLANLYLMIWGYYR